MSAVTVFSIRSNTFSILLLTVIPLLRKSSNISKNVIVRRLEKPLPCPNPGGGGVLSPFDGGGVRPEKKYRGVKELLFIPKKGGVREPE